jgi:flagellar capping protein FliD
MFDRDLAALYDVDTSHLNQAVSRNLDRFPEDFMFQLNIREFKNLISQSGISSWGGTRKRPRVFTEHGILMLSSVLNSRRAIRVNIEIMRTFARLREYILSHASLQKKMKTLEAKYDRQFRVVFEAIQEIGFHTIINRRSS